MWSHLLDSFPATFYGLYLWPSCQCNQHSSLRKKKIGIAFQTIFNWGVARWFLSLQDCQMILLFICQCSSHKLAPKIYLLLSKYPTIWQWDISWPSGIWIPTAYNFCRYFIMSMTHFQELMFFRSYVNFMGPRTKF